MTIQKILKFFESPFHKNFEIFSPPGGSQKFSQWTNLNSVYFVIVEMLNLSNFKK